MKIYGAAILLRNGVGFRFARAEMHRHLTELATRFYSGDVAACDDFLQLYCYGEEERKRNSASGSATPSNQKHHDIAD